MKIQWIENGYSIIRGAYNKDQIEKYCEIVSKARSELDDGKDKFGYGDRIGQLHQKYPELLDLASNSDILGFLRWAFNDEPLVFGSLNFERGTTQDAHIDAIFFWPEPSYTMAGCWVALEDVSPDAGPLFYVPKSHSWPFSCSNHVVATRPELASRRLDAREETFPADERNKLVGELGIAWTEDFKALEKKFETERIPLDIKAGDVVFWHSLLAHGGMPRIDPSLSRRSVVFHFIGTNTKLYSFDQFMLYDREEFKDLPEQQTPIGVYNNLVRYMKYPHFVTYKDGQETVHSL